MWKAYKIKISLSINEVFLEYITPIGLYNVSGYFNASTAELSSCGRAILGHKAKTIYYLVLSGESFLNT